LDHRDTESTEEEIAGDILEPSPPCISVVKRKAAGGIRLYRRPQIASLLVSPP
jgi:hypothetical protein